MVTDTRARPRSLGVGLLYGAGAGAVASIAMGIYAMVASLMKDTGFFTPLHHIASVLVDPADMMRSMDRAMTGADSFEISVGTALLGLLIHVVTGAAYGALFGLIVARLDLGAAVLAVAGLVWGGVVFVVSSFVGLPLAAEVFGVEDGPMGNPIADMPEMAGWGTFVIEHLLYGLVVGLAFALAASRRRGAATQPM